MQRIIIIAFVGLSLQNAMNGIPVDPVDITTIMDDITSLANGRIIFAGLPLVPKNYPKDDLIMAPKPRLPSNVSAIESTTVYDQTEPGNQIFINNVTEVPSKSLNQSYKAPLEPAYLTTVKSARVILEPANKHTVKSRRTPLESANETVIRDERERRTFYEILPFVPLQPTNTSINGNHTVKTNIRRNIFGYLPDHENLTNVIDDVTSSAKQRSTLGRISSASANLTNLDDDVVPQIPDNLYAVLPIEFENLTKMMDELGEVERMLSQSKNLTEVANDKVNVTVVQALYTPIESANLTLVMEDIMRESKGRGIFGVQPAVPHHPKLKTEEGMARASKARGIFAKIPQDISTEDAEIASLISEVPNTPELGLGYSNQIAKLKSVPSALFDQAPTKGDTVKIPIATQPYDNYKLLVVTAPPEVQMSGPNAEPWIIYVVLPNEDAAGNFSLPTVYFVNKFPDTHDKKVPQEPILVIDPNRKVTGLKSNDIEKIIKFKSKLASTLDYNKS